MGKKLELTNMRFGNLVALYSTGKKDKGNSFIWMCACDCGNEIEVSTARLVHSGRKNCGCRGRKPTNHGRSKDKIYNTWHNMLSRCHKKIRYYEDVIVCDRWDTSKGGSFENFLEDMGDRPEGTSLNRINGAKIYSKETCEWADGTIQAYDQRVRKDNESGYAGVTWSKSSNKWDARIAKGGKITCLGLFENIDDAIEARLKAEKDLYGFHRGDVEDDR